MWKNRNLMFLLFGGFVSELGIWFGLIGNLEFLQKNLSSHFLQGIILEAGLFISFLITPLAGSFADRFRKKNILVFVSVVRIIGALFMFLALAINNVWVMLIYNVLISAAGTFTLPASGALTPLIAKKEELLQANAMGFQLMTLARIFGTVLAGMMLTGVTLNTLYLYALVAYILVLVTTSMIRVNESVVEKQPKKNQVSRFRSLEVLPVIRNIPIVKYILVLAAIPFAFIGAFNLLIITIGEIHNSSILKGLIYAAEGALTLIPGFFLGQLTKGRNEFHLLLGACFFIGLSQILLMFSDWYIVPLLAFGLFGFATGIFMPLSSTVCQKNIPQQFLGRFFAAKRMIETLAMNVFVLGTGLILDTFGLKTMSIIFGTITVGITVLSFLKYTQEYKKLVHIAKPKST